MYTSFQDIPEDVLNTYCWIHSTYTIPSAFWKRIGIDVAHPGIDKTIDPEERRYVKYYQWVCFCLFFQVSKNVSFLVVNCPYFASFLNSSHTFCQPSMLQMHNVMSISFSLYVVNSKFCFNLTIYVYIYIIYQHGKTFDVVKVEQITKTA